MHCASQGAKVGVIGSVEQLDKAQQVGPIRIGQNFRGFKHLSGAHSGFCLH
jgi:hypothetical protein